MDKEKILQDLDMINQVKKSNVRNTRLCIGFAVLVVIAVLIWGFLIQLKALNKVVVIDRSGEYLSTKVYDKEAIFNAMVKNTCSLATQFANSFSITDLKLNQARSQFYINKSDLDKIFAKYYRDKAYSDVLNGGAVYQCKLEKVHKIEGKNEPYKVLFSSILIVTTNLGEKKFIITSKGELVSIRPKFPENVTGYYFSSLEQTFKKYE